MAFRFPLNTVLKYREELEKREERALEQSREILASLEAKVVGIQEQRHLLVVERRSLLERGVLGDDLHHAVEQQQQLETLESVYQKQVSDALLDYQKKMQFFLQARQKREILDELKSTQKESYLAQQERRDQHAVDEIFIARFKRDT